jgi:hypothetical protein
MRSTLRAVEPLLELHDLHVGVQVGEGLLGAVDLRHADAVGAVEDLPLEVRSVDRVAVDQADRADARRREIERRRGAEAARAEQEHPRVEQLRLSLLAHLGEERWRE